MEVIKYMVNKLCPQCDEPMEKDLLGLYCKDHGCRGEEGVEEGSELDQTEVPIIE